MAISQILGGLQPTQPHGPVRAAYGNNEGCDLTSEVHYRDFLLLQHM